MTTSTVYYKVTNELECHHGFQYQDGLNELPDPFVEEGTCVPGGFYFTSKDFIHHFLSLGVYIREVRLPTEDPEFRMVKDQSGKCWRANKIILGKRYNIFSIDISNTFSNITKIDILYACCRVGQLNTLKQLIETVDRYYFNSIRALEYAITNYQLDIVKFIYSKYNLADYKQTLIYLSIASGDISIISFIFNQYPHVYIDSRVMNYAIGKRDMRIIEFLHNRSCNVSEMTIKIAKESGDPIIIHFFQQQYPDLFEESENM